MKREYTTPMFYIGLILTTIGSICLDSEGKGYTFAITCSLIGIAITLVSLAWYYRNEKKAEENRIARAIERERRRA